MAQGMYRIAIVGASSLAGKELADELGESLLAASDVSLLDDEEVAGETAGQVASVGDEATVIHTLDEASFERMDFVFLAGTAETARRHWEAARMAGASIVDMTYALEGEPGVAVRAPLVRAAMGRKTSEALDFATVAVVAAAPAAVMLALVAERIAARIPLRSIAATIFEPASEHGREAMDELHQQTVNLLSFQSLPREQYDAQLAFNVLAALGEAAKVDLPGAAARILRHFALITASNGMALPPLEAQVVHGPVFHGYVASVLVELEQEVGVEAVEAALTGEGIDVVAAQSDPPSNLSAAGQEDVMVLVRATGSAATSRRFWLWLAADNLKLGALNAIACANELKRLRPRGSVQ